MSCTKRPTKPNESCKLVKVCKKTEVKVSDVACKKPKPKVVCKRM